SRCTSSTVASTTTTWSTSRPARSSSSKAPRSRNSRRGSPPSTATRSRSTRWCCTYARSADATGSGAASFGSADVAQQPFRRGSRLSGQLHAAEHAGELFLSLFRVQQAHLALGHALAGCLADPVVRVSLRGDLRQVGHAQHLAAGAKRAQLLSD